MAFKMKYKNLKEVVKQLRSAVQAHGEQADTIEKHIDDMEEGGNSPMKKEDCNCWEGYKRVPGTKRCAEGSCEKK
tara:strand:+ start:393 stop:617 length:225 start_codon:yes stop_codon:yes gene_type:complete